MDKMISIWKMRALTGRRFYSLKNIKKSVFISQSKDVYTNLALEEWINENFDFANHHVMLLTQNDPCVTIGKNGNPWAQTKDVKIARKSTDSEAVYADGGNLNVTFFTPNEYLDRNYNLEVISRAIFRQYNVNQIKNQNGYLSLRDKKISTDSVKLGRLNAYHNCSLFVNVNKNHFDEALSAQDGFHGINVQSDPLKMTNLTEEYKKADVKSLKNAIGWEFLRVSAVNMLDGGKNLANKQMGFQMINPTENWFPGITEIRNKLVSWQWLYGETPTFTFSRSYSLKSDKKDIKVNVQVKNGIISDISCWIPPSSSIERLTYQADIIFNLKNQKFSHEVVNVLDEAFTHCEYEKDEKFISDYKQAMISI